MIPPLGRYLHVAAPITALCVYGISLLAVMTAGPHGPAVGSQSAAPAFAARGTSMPQLVGFSLNVYHTNPFAQYLTAVDQIAATGFNCVQVVTSVFQRDGASQRVAVEVGPGRGPARSELIHLLQYAKANELITCLMPQVNFTHPRTNEWRGKIQPATWRSWWHGYATAIDYFLSIAVEAEVDLFCVGCELISTQKPEYLPRWQELIA